MSECKDAASASSGPANATYLGTCTCRYYLPYAFPLKLQIVRGCLRHLGNGGRSSGYLGGQTVSNKTSVDSAAWRVSLRRLGHWGGSADSPAKCARRQGALRPGAGTGLGPRPSWNPWMAASRRRYSYWTPKCQGSDPGPGFPAARTIQPPTPKYDWSARTAYPVPVPDFSRYSRLPALSNSPVS